MTAAGPSGRDGPLAFVESTHEPALDDADRHHLQQSLRLRPGDPMVVSDGAGSWRHVRFGAPLEPVSEVIVVDRPTVMLTVGLTPTKGDRPEWAVQKLTELSIDRIVILRTDRSVVRWEGDKVDHHLQRLRRIAREAAMQSRRVWLPEVTGVVADLAVPGAVRADQGGRPLDERDHTVLTGPEGGWSDAERAAVEDHVGLAPAVLRAETAAITAGVLLAALRHGLVSPA